MSFIQTGFLMACAAAAIPVIVHLLNRWQVRHIELGTMRFLHEIVRDGAQRRKIRRWLLLLTRMALVVLLALLFARPFFSERTRRDGDRMRVILVDRSASMGMPGKSGRLIDDAVGAAATSAAELGEDAKILWAWFDQTVEPILESTARPTAPRTVVGDTNYLAALSWARDRIDAYPDSLADVVMVTDLQQSGIAAEQFATEGLAFPSDVPVRVIDVGRPAANNLAITSVSVPATRVEPAADVVLSVTLFNFGTLAYEEVPLAAAMFDGQRTVRLKKPINVPSGQAEEVMFDFGKLEPGTWQATVSIDVDDDLAADNRRLTAVDVANPIEVLVLDSGTRESASSAASYYLVTALEQSDQQREDVDQEQPRRSRFSAEVHYLSDESLPTPNQQTHPLVIVADASALSATVIQQLETYVRDGGRLLVFAGDGAGGDAAQWWFASGLSPGELQSPQRSGTMPFRITTVSRGGAMLQPFEDPQHGDLSRLAFQKRLPVELAKSTEVLAWFDQNRPALTKHSLDHGRVVWFLSSADASWGNWTTSPLYLPMVQQMAGDLLNMTGEGPIRFRLIGDDAEQVSDSVQGQTPSPLTFAQSGFEPQPEALYVVNGVAKESDPARIDVGQFAEHFKITLADATQTFDSTSVESEKRNEVWPWFAAAAFVLLIGEFTLANRTSA